MIMQTRFVVVPAVPREKELFPRRTGFPAALSNGYDLYDTQEKIRLSFNFSSRAEAEHECEYRNSPRDLNDSNVAGHA
ncbi:hypothetical protein AAH995_20690 [Pseudomonas putida]|uniref:hypothetical protein n=1 Tax=Pseudomonas TaxID=286 RepID=UPI0018D9AF20|nr:MULTISPECIES: hypothetical protein [Pseudomonas]MBH3371861.1 hypothetical protein [Pseudomonas juntendi]